MKSQMKRAIKKIAPNLTEEIGRLRSIDERIATLMERMEGSDTRLDDLKARLKEVEHYQPLYNISGIINTPMRDSYDRCVAIENALGDVAGKRILDLGSSLGYVSFYMADRGAAVQGWEENVKNAEVSRLVGNLNGIGVDFKTKEFNDKTVDTIPQGGYDVAILLSVAHHIIRFNGLDYTQKLMKDLMERVPELVVELARKGEDPSLPWDASQPEDELAIFDLIKDEIDIEKIGDFGNHLSDKTRPLYLIRKKRILNVNSHTYEYDEVKNVAYKGSPVAYHNVQRRYYYGKNFVAKEYILDKGLPKDTYGQIFNEIQLLTNIADKKIHNLPDILDFEVSKGRIVVVYRLIEGRLLYDEKLNYTTLRKLLLDVLRTVRDLHALGYNHNDIRSWNVIISQDKKKAYLIDYGTASPIEDNSDILAVFQLIVDNQDGGSARTKRYSAKELIKKLPDEWGFLKDKISEKTRPEQIIEAIETTRK